MQNFVRNAMRCRVADTMHPMALCSRRIMCFSAAAAAVVKSPQQTVGKAKSEPRSRRHFQILRDRVGQYLLHDVGSTTGTFLMIREELALEDQMIIQLLGSILRHTFRAFSFDIHTLSQCPSPKLKSSERN